MQIYDGQKKPEVLVDGWNVYFFEDLKALVSILQFYIKSINALTNACITFSYRRVRVQSGRWPQVGKNTETVGELWLGLLRFYTEEFDFREHVVCIRQHVRLTTFNKQWTSKYIVIEGQLASRCSSLCVCWLIIFVVFWIVADPFDLNHNLGAGLSRKSTLIYFPSAASSFLSFFVVYFISHLFLSVTNFIMKAFINGRRVFGTPFKAAPPIYPSLMASICMCVMGWKC